MSNLNFVMKQVNYLEALEDIVSVVILPTSFVLSGYLSNLPNTEFTGKNHLGDLIYTGGYSHFSDYAARRIEIFGEKTGNKLIKKFGQYFSEITIPLVTTYFVLGETIINCIPLNTMDEKDIYAALLGGTLGFLHARRKKRRRESK